MRYRLATAEDFPTCQRLTGRAFRASRKIYSRIPQLWNELLTSNSGSLTVIEDPERPHPDGIEAFAACVFVSDAFIADFIAAPRPYLPAIIYERAINEESPILSLPAIRDGNSGPGLNLVCLHFSLRDPDLDHPRTRQVLQVANTAFFFFCAGYRINTLYQEVYGPQHAAYLKAGGSHLIADFKTHFLRETAPPTEADHPYLLGLRKDQIAPGAVNPLSHLFHSLPPRFDFTTTSQRVLERALLLQTDEEIAEELEVSVDAIKKTWRAIYERVDNVAPRMFGTVARAADHRHRSTERRRHLLGYLRTHLEELRPTNNGRSTRPLRPSGTGMLGR